MRSMNKNLEHPDFLENEHFKLLEQALHAGLFQISENNDNLICSPAFCELLGYPNNTINLSKSFFSINLFFLQTKKFFLKRYKTTFNRVSTVC
jgi:PAS domain-containing protein